MLIEAAWSYQYPARIAKEKAEILVRLPKTVRDIAWKAQTRLCTRYRSMVARGNKPTSWSPRLRANLSASSGPSVRRYGCMRAHAEIQISPKDIYDYVCNDSDEDCPKHSYLETTATAVIFTFCHRAMTGEPRR